jgi:hypothetical protein
MALDDTCSDFFSLVDLTPKGQTTRPAIEWLHQDTKRLLALHPDRYTNDEPRTLIALCDAILGDWEAPAMPVIFQRLLRLARALLEGGNYFPGSAQSDEAARWLNIVVDDIKSTTSLTSFSS